MSSDSPVQAGQMLAGKYRVDRVLGQGGMGVVVAATHTQLDQKVAVKFLLPEAATHSQATARFLREARAAVKIQSEYVARVIDVGTLEETGTPYMVMEYLDGSDLEHVVESQGPLPIEEAVEYVMQACAALAEAHSHGIIHRDLKPANLFRIVRSDGAPVIKVLDFGISKMTLGTDGMDSANLTGTAAVLGTPMYMSPEQIRSSRDVDNRTDIWSLGSILQELLTGDQPFPADTMPQLFAAILEAQPTPLSSVRPDIPEGLQEVVHKCLTKSPDDRYPNVAALAADLAPFGPARSVALSERTSRVLGVASAPMTQATPRPSQAPGAEGQPSLTMGATMKAQTGTAWGTTHDAPGNRKLVLGASIAAAVLGLGVLGALFFLHGGGETQASVEPTPAVTPPAEQAEAPSPTATATATVATPAPSVEPIVAASATPEVEPEEAEAEAPAPAPRAAPKPKRAPRAPRVPAPARQPAPATVTKSNPLDIELK